MTTNDSPSKLFAHLNEGNKAHVEDIINYADDTRKMSEEKQGSNSPISNKFYDDGDSSAIKNICNDTASETDEIWLSLTDHVS